MEKRGGGYGLELSACAGWHLRRRVFVRAHFAVPAPPIMANIKGKGCFSFTTRHGSAHQVLGMVLAGRAVELHPEFCRQAVDTGLTEAERKFFEKARQLDNLDSDEEEDPGDEVAEFTNEIKLDKHDEEYLWRDKYQARKPRFFNRVFTGFEWNTYNRTHYDRDNPPPKMVQGQCVVNTPARVP